ncbi:MAG: glycosyl transferase [Spirochaetes bacterium]|nr:glycosyl transferase [Spirochaetota bacterium]HOD15605.1 glycosyl transferase [Spirochaetota bacterium]HPG52716.1 glycosyl transferase [Spirochaetota bacterium]
MADFFQNGTITTLQNISKRPAETIEEELRQFSLMRNMVLLLPALFSEFEGPAMPRIIEELKKIDYISKIIISLDRADADQFAVAKKRLSVIPGDVKVVWHDGPRLLLLYKELSDAGFDITTVGKGRSVWMTLGYILADRDTYAIGLHDTDIVNYSREMVARLFYPVVHPALDYEFSKGYYARVTDRFYGRVTRLFYTPLIRSLKKILGYNRFLEFLDSFRFALSGEFAFIATLARGLRISPTWGLEVSMLSEIYSKTTVNRVAQVELLDTYDHKHQSIEKQQRDTGLFRMSNEIAKTLFKVLTQDGIVMSGSFFRTLLATYIQESRFAIEKYNAVAMFNDLNYDRHEEVVNTEIFVEALKQGVAEFMEDPIGVPMLPGWVRIRAALPGFQKKFKQAVEEDNS